MSFKVGDMVLAKCQNYPYWPAKIIKSNQHCYQVLFYGEKTHADIDFDSIISFTEEDCKKVLSHGNNRNNKELRNSIAIANKKYKRKMLNKPESSSQDDQCYHQSSEPKKQIEKKKKSVHISLPPEPPLRTTEDELKQCSNLLISLEKDLMQPTVYKSERIRYFLEKDEERLRQLLGLPQLTISKLIEAKIVEKMIIILKEFYTFKLEFSERQALMALVESKYNECKSLVLSEKLSEIPLSQLRKENIFVKVSHFKSCI